MGFGRINADKPDCLNRAVHVDGDSVAIVKLDDAIQPRLIAGQFVISVGQPKSEINTNSNQQYKNQPPKD